MTQLAFVSDQLATPGGYGGAEKVLSCAYGLYPGTPIYTPVYHPGRNPEAFTQYPIHTSFIQNLPLGKTHVYLYFPLLPWAMESFNLQVYDVIVSFHHSVAKGVIPRPDAVHLCYCHSPARYLWDQYWDYMVRVPRWQAGGFTLTAPWMRTWDVATASRVDRFIANATITAQRIKRFYNREADILFPPVEVDRFINRPAEDFYLMAGRLVEYKGFDIAVETFNRLKRRLVIVGIGPEYKKLRRMAGPTIQFKGRVSDDALVDLMSRCQGFIFPGVEDFGLVMVEAQAAGKPVIALDRGGARDIVIPGETGLWVREKTPEAFAHAVELADKLYWSVERIQTNARRFAPDQFITRFKAILDPYLSPRPTTFVPQPSQEHAEGALTPSSTLRL